MNLVNRTTCLYCEQEGRDTPLIWLGRRGCCPIHSRDYLLSHGVDPDAYLTTPPLKGAA